MNHKATESREESRITLTEAWRALILFQLDDNFNIILLILRYWNLFFIHITSAEAISLLFNILSFLGYFEGRL